MMKIGFIGCGRMGQAILKGMLARKVNADKIFITDKHCNLSNFASDKVQVLANAVQVVEESDVILLAVKPQDMQEILDEIKFVAEHKLFVSIAAGLSTEFFERNLQNAKIIRVMPNLAVAVGELAGAYCLGKSVRDEDKEILKELFGEDALLLQVKEEQMHVVTALSGSGPAFVSFLINAFAEVAEKEGLTKKDALLLTEKTFLGSAKLLLLEKKFPEQLMEEVASKGGITEKGLKKLQESNFKQIINDAFAAAIKRSKELSK